MNKNLKKVAALGAALVAGATFSPMLSASAGQAHGDDHPETVSADRVLEANPNGRQEVSPTGARGNVGDPNGGGKAFVFSVEGPTPTICYVLALDRINTPTAAHIHKGVRGENGPIVINLEVPVDSNAGDCISESDTDSFPTGETGIIEDVLANPTDYYVNVHNEKFPAGAVRGQLRVER